MGWQSELTGGTQHISGRAGMSPLVSKPVL